MTLRERVRTRLGLDPMVWTNPRPLRQAVRRASAQLTIPADRLEIDPVRGTILVPCDQPFSTSGGFRLKRQI